MSYFWQQEGFDNSYLHQGGKISSSPYFYFIYVLFYQHSLFLIILSKSTSNIILSNLN